MNRAAKLIHLDAARRQGLTGKGIGVAIFDTGIGYHPDLFPDRGRAGLAAFYDTFQEKSQYYDDNGHGTHIAGILAGNGASCHGKYPGIAPNCHYVVIKILNKQGEGNIENVLMGIHWLLEHAREYDIRIVNISVGSTRGKNFGETSPLVESVNKLWSAGLTVFTAAGNHGPSPSSIGAPGNSRKIITVGSSDVVAFTSGRDFSGRGPTENCIKKPDIVAPGSQITSCYPMVPGKKPGTYLPLPTHKESIEYYQGIPYLARTGTSMATPIVTGCAALLLEKYPRLTNKEVKMRMRKTARDLGFPHARQGWGLLELDRLLG
ncbi:MAG: S8 family peptidase [Lachnospiraceae bacterium]|nr:S8 family peptidase [Lachnospiraceae bacterium]